MSTDAVGTQETPLYPPTGEPIGEIARRTKVGLWTLIVMSVSGTLALVVSYSYLWALNVNGGWAPPGASLLQPNQLDPSLKNDAVCSEWPWAIFGLTVLATTSSSATSNGKVIATACCSAAVCHSSSRWHPRGPVDPDHHVPVWRIERRLRLGSSAAVRGEHLQFADIVFLHIGLLNRTRKGLIAAGVLPTN